MTKISCQKTSKTKENKAQRKYDITKISVGTNDIEKKIIKSTKQVFLYSSIKLMNLLLTSPRKYKQKGHKLLISGIVNIRIKWTNLRQYTNY